MSKRIKNEKWREPQRIYKIPTSNQYASSQEEKEKVQSAYLKK